MGMLVLTRRPQEAVRIAGNIQVIVLGMRGGQARLGIIAPADVQVDREEIALKKEEEGRALAELQRRRQTLTLPRDRRQSNTPLDGGG